MPRKDPRIDAYIAKSAKFAQPILKHLRALVHESCPDVVETIKWSMPHFDYEGVLCGMAAFKQHVTFGFWKGKLLLDTKGLPVDEAMGQFGRITSVSDLPSVRAIAGYVKKAMKLNEDGVVVKREVKARKPIAMPAVLRSALVKAPKARATYDGLSPSHRREYLEWVTEAKTEATRDKRIATTIEWLSEGKHRNWKYERS